MNRPTLSKFFANLFLLVTLFITCSCHRSLPPQEYKAWITDPANRLHVTESHGDFVFDLQFQPEDLLRLEQPTRDTARSGGAVAMQYYLLKIKCVDPSVDLVKYKVASQAEWQRRLYYYSYLFQNDIFLEENGTRYPCVLFHFENTDLSGNRSFALGFDIPGKISAESKIIIESPQFGSLPVKIEIEKDNIPTLKI